VALPPAAASGNLLPAWATATPAEAAGPPAGISSLRDRDASPAPAPDSPEADAIKNQPLEDTNTSRNLNTDTSVLEYNDKRDLLADASVAAAGSQGIPGWPGSEPDTVSSGRPLTDFEKDKLRPYIPEEDLNNARIHVGEVPFYLPKDKAGITRDNDIYFRPDQYDPSTVKGIARLGHELVHVGQYRQGMTWATYLLSMPKGYDEESRYEKPACDMEKRIRKDLTPKP
jgi:hypothetical protein